MIIIPKAKPIINNLNSFYLDMGKLIEHHQAELQCGTIHLKSPAAEGMIYFDEDSITNVFLQEENHLIDGTSARDELIRKLKVQNFTVSVYQIQPDILHYWANLSYAEDLYGDLDTQTTALDSLVKRMNIENLTGYINVALTDPPDKGMIFFMNGSIIGIAGSWAHDQPSDTKQHLQHLIVQSKKAGAAFNVKRIDLGQFKGKADSPASGKNATAKAVGLLQALLATLESLVIAEKRIKTDFDTLLKKKFFEKADTYEFLDPFAAEVEYADGTFGFSGDAPLAQVVKGVSESVIELAEDLGLQALLLEKFTPLKNDYQDEITRFGINI